MANWAIINNNVVINIIVADTKEIAEQATQATAIEYDANRPVARDWYLENGIWYAPKPTDDKNYKWDESMLSWVEEVTE